MDLSFGFLMLLGYVIGLVGFPLSQRVSDSIDRSASLGLKDNRSQALVMLATLAQLFVLAFVILVPLQIFGFIPLREKGPYFCWSFLLGSFSFGVWKWFKIRPVKQAHKLADIERQARLAESLEIEIAERQREQNQERRSIGHQTISMSAALVQILELHYGRGVRGSGVVWRIEGSTSRVEQCKVELLETVCRYAQPIVHYYQPPTAVPELGGVVELDGRWQLPLGTSGAALLQWLYLGNWQLYVRVEPLSNLPDLSRCADAEVEAFMIKSKASIVIDSFHDDVSWVIGLRVDV